ncbi:MAG: tRNA pseudouridine(38-40) synthase TruA [Myxococcota bacterium]|nr:tRNA pseudouridine(38-40) synthase TruA [Myxococcota bacterium]
MPKYRLEVEYAGEAFAGWQIQAGGERTVQGCLVEAVARVTGERVTVMGSGRTDAGVHAEAQVASLALKEEIEPGKLQRALNGVLPREVAVRAAYRVDEDFDALRSAQGKRYRYRIWNHPVRSPLRAGRFAHVPRALDVGAMAQAAQALVGEHDFQSFQAAGSGAKTTVRRLRRLEIRGGPGGEIEVVAEGSGFLRYMVRNLVGTLLEVGQGRRSGDSMVGLLEVRDRGQAGPTAPAAGLTLEAVEYPEGVGEAGALSPTSDGKTAASEDGEA